MLKVGLRSNPNTSTMKKVLMFCLLIASAHTNIFAQCGTPVQSVYANFSSGLPACWFSYGVSVTFETLIFNTGGGGDRWVVLPMTDNCKGILEFDALNSTNGQAGPGNFQFGVASITGSNAMTTFELVEAQDIYYASSGGALIYTHHVIDYSAYSGTGQYIVIWMSGAVSREMRLDNVSYISACLSQSVTALTQDISVQLDATGNASIVVADVDNGSTSDCGTPTLTIDVSDFTCDDIGANAVTLTADDGNGNVETALATVTVLAAIADETVTAAVSVVCNGSSTTITTGSSVVGVEYFLR